MVGGYITPGLYRRVAAWSTVQALAAMPADGLYAWDLRVSLAHVSCACQLRMSVAHVARPESFDFSPLTLTLHTFNLELDMNFSLSIGPLVSLIAGILILIMPRLLSTIVALYLIVMGILGLIGMSSLKL